MEFVFAKLKTAFKTAYLLMGRICAMMKNAKNVTKNAKNKYILIALLHKTLYNNVAKPLKGDL